MKRSFGFALPGVLLLGVFLCFGGPAIAERSAAPRVHAELIPSWPGEVAVSLEVLVDGRPLRTVTYQGQTYLPVPQLGTEYEIRVWNHGLRRVAAVLSVDGLSVITGQPASETDPGYLVASHHSLRIKGWRKSMDTVAAFRFVDRGESYAARVGKPHNIGVIGLVAIEEVGEPPVTLLEKKEAAPLSADRARGMVGSTGTEYGRTVESRMEYVPFVRSSNKRTVTLYYDTVEALREAGVPVGGALPVPFPGDSRFVPPPPGKRGK